MKLSVNWVKKFHNIDIPIDELVEKIGAQLGAVDEVIDLAPKYKDVVIAKVVSCTKHPNADKLSVCMVDDGGTVKNVKRQEGLVEVVCGAPNVAAGQVVAWLPPGSVVPNTYNKEPFTLEAREIRGVVSNGMIASAKELALGDDHEGILVLENNLKPGDSFAQIYQLNDTIIDIENKMFTHRPDLFGILGLAREIAGINHHSFKSPSWYTQNPSILTDGRKNVLKLEVKNEIPKLVPRFCAVAIKDVKVAPSPVWLQTKLASVGIRPINNIVDVTNFLMHETAQPLHAYDYDKVKSGVLGIRGARKGEKLNLLNGKTIVLEPTAMVITDGSKAIGLGGVMGGADTEVDENTRNIILECATFDMNTTRRTAMEYGLFTDAATRFTKNQSPMQNLAVIAKALDAVQKVAGGRMASKVIDDKYGLKQSNIVKVSIKFINNRLGLNLTATEIKKILQNVEFDVSLTGDNLSVAAPFWRTDIEIPEDIVEEVGRLYGYDHLPMVLPTRSISPGQTNEQIVFVNKVREILRLAGANEVLTYSFVHKSLLNKVGQDEKQAHHIKNAISPDLQYYRVSLAPSLLEKVHPNIKLGFDQLALFEVGKAHIKALEDDEKLPVEFSRLALALANKNSSEGSAYYHARKYLDYLCNELNVQMNYQLLSEAKNLPTQWNIAATCFEPNRSAVVYGSDKSIIGLVGEPKTDVKGSLKLPSFSAQLELDIEQLQQLARPKQYTPLNKFPETSQDICLKVGAELKYEALNNFIRAQLDKAEIEHGYSHLIEPIDIFQKTADKDHKQITWRITLWHPQRTLTTAEVNKLFDMIASEAKQDFKAERI